MSRPPPTRLAMAITTVVMATMARLKTAMAPISPHPAQKLGKARDTSAGHDLWPDEYADLFCAKFAEGTMARFVFELAMRTALRLGDLHPSARST